MPIIQDLGPLYRGEDETLQFTMTPTTDITGWTISFRLKQRSSDVTALVTQSATITSAVGGVFTVSLSASTTTDLAPNIYSYDVWRTDSGSAALLSIGTVTLRSSVRVP